MRTSSGTHRKTAYLGALILAGALALSGCTTTGTGLPGEPDDPVVDPAKIEIPAADGPGVTATTIGLASPGGMFDEATNQSIIEQMNKEGGLAGRSMTFSRGPKYQAAATAPISVWAQAECEAFKNEPQYLVYLDMINSLVPEQAACVNKLGVAAIALNEIQNPAAMKAAPYTFGLYAPDAVIAGVSLVRLLDDDGYFEGATNTVLFALPSDDRSVTDAMVAELDARGISAALEQPDLSSDTAALNFILKLKEQGVDHLIPAPGQSTDVVRGLLETMVDQKYRVEIGALGFPIDNSPLGSFTPVPAAAFSMVHTYDWRPTMAGIPAQQSFDLLLSNPAAQECIQVATAANVNLGTQLEGMLRLCDEIRFLRASLAASGSDSVNAQAIAVGAHKLEDFTSALTFATGTQENGSIGPIAVRKLEFSPDVSSFSFVGENLSLSTK